MLKFFQNAIDNDMTPQPNEMWKNDLQAFVDEEWDNSASVKTIKEQNGIGSSIYTDIEAWVIPVIEDSITGRKNGEDFCKLLFKDLNHSIEKGLLYFFDNNYWITYFFNDYSSVTKDISIRRCNNWLKIVDPVSGEIYKIPCVVDYNMQSPNNQTTKYVLTPNNHASVIVQGNADSTRLFKTNKRFVLGGRPFKLYSFQNLLLQDSDDTFPTLMYIELYLDEPHAKDDLVNGVADNGDYNYEIVIGSDDCELSPNATGKFTCDVLLNGDEVEKEVTWESEDDSLITIDESGNYIVGGEASGVVSVSCYLTDNISVVDSIQVTIKESPQIEAFINITPYFERIREYETIDFVVEVYNDGVKCLDANVDISLDGEEQVNTSDYLRISKNGTTFTLECLKRTKVVQKLYIAVSNDNLVFVNNYEVEVTCVSMMGG